MIFKTIKKEVDSIVHFKYLLALLVRRNFMSRYRRSVLGVLWPLLNPLLMMLVITMVFSHMFSREIENYPVYLLSGQLIFNYFSESTKQAMRSVTDHAGIIKKVYVPKCIFVLARVLSSLVNLLFSFAAFMLIFIVMRMPFQWAMLLIPIPVIYTLVFALGVGLILSSLAVFFRDITYIYDIFILLLMYMTPLFYPASLLSGTAAVIMNFNPIYHFVSYFRSLALSGIVPGLWQNLVCAGFSLTAFCIGVYVFIKQQPKYILYL